MTKASRLSAVIFFAASIPLAAQYAEQNVNMVAGTQWPHGDPYLQRQNEPSVAVSTRNPLHLLAGANDYRTVDIPFDTPASPDNEERGDAWLGVFKSRNGGQTWWSDLLDGYPQQTTSTSPLHGFAAGADPVVRSGPNGMFYYSGIVLNRDPNPLGGVFVARFIDNNNTENGDPIAYAGASMIDKGTSGAFIDKPWVAVGPGSGQCTVGGQTFPAQNVYLAYTIFVGGDNNIRTKLMFARSTDCGATWSAPQKLSEGYPVNQGAQIAVSPAGPIYVVWRLFKSTTNSDAVMIAKSTDGGQTFTKASTVATINPFEQGMAGLPNEPAIRTNAYPATAVDSTGRVYVVWADRGFNANGDGRIVMMHSPDGVSWTGPFAIDGTAARGHQFMPTISTAGGKIVVAYYDLRDDSTMGIYSSNHDGTYIEQRIDVGDRLLTPSPVFSKFLQEYAGEKRRHTLELRATELNISATGPTLSGETSISRYAFGVRNTPTTDCPDGVAGCIEQLQYNPPNLPLFRLGTTPFIGDYIDMAAYSPKTSPVYHITWTDNRDVRPPADGNWANYTAVGPGHTSTFDGTTSTVCQAGQTGMRNQNIYTSRVTDGVFAGSPGNSKQLTIQRAFAVFVQNPNGGLPRDYQLTTSMAYPAICPAGSTGSASFDQLNPATTSIVVSVPAHSTATRTVYVMSSCPHATATIDITEVGSPANTTQVVLNPDVSNPDVSNPDVSNPDVSNPDVSNPDVSNPDVSNSEVHNPDVSNPDVSNPDVSNPDVSNPDVSNPDVSNTGYSNPDVSNPDVSNPDVSNPDVSNPDVSNPDVSNTALGDSTDTTWTVHNKGNTTSGYDVKLFSNSPVDPNNVHTQLIVYRLYQTPMAVGCDLKAQSQRQILSNVIDPTFGATVDSAPSNATFWLAPGDGARITVRTYAPRTVFNPATQVAPVLAAEAANVIDGVVQTTVINGRTVPDVSVALPPTMPLFITTNGVNDAVAGQSYSTPFSASGGTLPYTWSVNVPSGAGIDANGVLTYTAGFPNAGTGDISVSVTDAAGTTATRRYFVNVYSPLTITTAQLPSGSLGQPYPATTLAASGGLTPYTWGVDKGFIPAGMTLDPATGILSGTPTETADEFLTLKVTDSANPAQTATRQFGLTITNPLAVATTSLPNAAQGFAYSTSLVATGGVAPIHWTAVSSMPDGMSLSDDGTISGVCPFTETPVIQVRATDSSNPPLTVLSQQMPLTVYSSVCPASAFQLFDNSNTFAVSNGGNSPTFSTDGQTYCLDSLVTEHQNGGNGATPGTIGLTTNCSTSCTSIGPWQAVGDTTNENWTAVPSPPGTVIVMNGTYSVADSDPSTWSQNTTSNGFGFSHVWVKDAVPSTMVAVPATVAAGDGQLAVFNLSGLSSLNSVTVSFADQNGNTADGFLFTSPSTPNRLYVRLPSGLTNGSLTTTVNMNGAPIASTTITQSTTPGTPVIQAIRNVTPATNSCGNVAQQTTTSITIGGSIAVSAFGIDTTGAEVRFTQGTATQIVGSTCGVDSATIGEAAIIAVPANLTFGSVDVSIRTTVNGVTSAWSQPITVTAAPQLF